MSANHKRSKFGIYSLAVTLKIRARSPKPNQVFIMSQCYIQANLIPIPLGSLSIYPCTILQYLNGCHASKLFNEV